MNRSSDNNWSVDSSFASTNGWRVGITRIDVPMATREVTAAAYVRATIGSSHGLR
jgi:hypothetical protein